MSPTVSVAVLVGSLRKDSYSKKVADALMKNAPPGLHFVPIEIGDLPLYNEDLEEAPPPAWKRFRDEIAGTAAVLFVTPEYNRSIPGCLKNALDVGSRPEHKSVWDGKPAAVVSVTPYKLGGFGANHALRQTFVFLNMPVLQQPEAYISEAKDLFAKDGSLKSDEQKKFFTKLMRAFSDWVGEKAGGSFESFMKQREKAATAYVHGDGSLVDAIAASSGDATFFPPSGGALAGVEKVRARYAKDAKSSFSNEASNRFEVLQHAEGGGVAFWTGFQIADVTVHGKKTHFKLRVTEAFRLQDGEWKLVHRHADKLAETEN